MLDDSIIRQVNASPWISNLVAAKKKNWGLCICVDLRAVNKAITPDRYPSTTEEFTAQFYGSTVFSKLHGYLQAPLHPGSCNLTAFITHKGVFRYKTPLWLLGFLSWPEVVSRKSRPPSLPGSRACPPPQCMMNASTACLLH